MREYSDTGLCALQIGHMSICVMGILHAIILEIWSEIIEVLLSVPSGRGSSC